MPQNQTQSEIQTIGITNFSGRLTRIINGDLNSGFAKFTQSWGYDPFSKPMNLTWLETPATITGTTDLILVAKPRFEAGIQFIYALGHTGKLYKIQPTIALNSNSDSVVGITSITAGGPSYNFGASMEFFGATEKIYIGADQQINTCALPPDGSADAVVGTGTNYVGNRFRPLKQFVGKLFYGNGNNIGAIDSTGTIVASVATNGILSPQLSAETYLTDLDTSPDGNYLYLTGSTTPNENIMTVASDHQNAASGEGNVYKWNGTDVGITAFNTIPSYAVTALQTYLQGNFLFSNDSFGSSLNDGTNKILTLPGNKSPFANATGTNGNFIFWIAPEITTSGTGLSASMYYFGSLDQENPPGLYRLMRYPTTLASGFIYQTPLNILTNNKYSTVNNAITAVGTLGYGKHYFSFFDVNNSTSSYRLFQFLTTPTGVGTAQAGAYETQTQLFSKKVAIKQLRFYTEGTTTNNAFQIDLIGSDGNIITNGTFNYTYAAGTDPTKMQGSLERIDFNPAMKATYALGLRITNTGSANMAFHKAEVDWVPAGK